MKMLWNVWKRNQRKNWKKYRLEKKILAMVMSISTAFALTACVSARPAASDPAARREQAREEIASNSKEDEKEEAIQDTEQEGNGEADSGGKDTADEGGAGTGIVFGSEDAAGYRGFQYLTEERIATSRTDSKKEAAFSVYIPKEEHPRVSGSSARSENAGVYVKVDLEPYLQYKAKDYSLRSNLQKYVDREINYDDDYFDIVTGNIQETGQSAVCEVSYMEYDAWNEEYLPRYAVYGLYLLHDDIMALVSVIVNEEDTTDGTQALLTELEAFYEMEIGWTPDFAGEKQEAFDHKNNANNFEVYSLSFTLPEGWMIDEEMSDDYETMIVPGGDSESADECIALTQSEDMTGMLDWLLEDLEMLKEEMEEDFIDESDYMEIEDIGMTFLGRTIKMEMAEHVDDHVEAGVMYVAEDDNNLYMIYAYTVLEDGEETKLSESVMEALEMLFETGRIMDSMM